MIFQKQTIPNHDPANGVYGNCFPTCIACLLELPVDEVPHIYDEGRSGKQGMRMLRDFLKQRGLYYVELFYDNDLDDILRTFGHLAPEAHYLISGKSPRGNHNHTVIARGGQLFWDPSPKVEEPALDGRCEDGYHWVGFITSHIDNQTLSGGIQS